MYKTAVYRLVHGGIIHQKTANIWKRWHCAATHWL